MTATATRPAPRATASARAGTVVPLAAAVLLLSGLGLVMVLSASSVQALREYGSSWLFFRRQLLYLGIGGAAMIVTTRVDYRVWARLALPLLGCTIAGLVAVLVPGVGVTVSGSTRWIDLGITQVQPAEFAKLAVLVFGADLLARRHDRMEDAGAILKPMLLVFGVVGVLVMLEPDMGTTMVVASIVGALLFLGGTPMAWMVSLGLGGGMLGMVVALAEPYRRARMLSFVDPWADAGNTGYQVVQSLVGIGSGQLKGVGLGASRAKWGFLPNAHTDFIFAIVGEELGLIGALFVLLLFIVIAFFGVRAAFDAPDRFGGLLAAGVTAWITCQALINIGAVVGVLPVTGVPLPFVSYGGSSLIVLLAATGILLNVARAGAHHRRA
ncbi:MAG TPA: putative lipid II flippase FtsW [Acidimicrobiales bacterium]|nr:putative lipid II flippase FtsW [Acidimicrobiales bacterium]